MNNGNKFYNPFKNDINWYFLVIFILAMAIGYYNMVMGIVSIGLLLVLILINFFSSKVKKQNWKKYIDNISTNVDSAARNAVFSLPIPLIITDFNGQINWYNSEFTETVDDRNIIGKNINSIINNLSLEELQAGEDIEQIKHGERLFTVKINIIGSEDENSKNVKVMVYWFEETEYYHMITKYEDEKTVLALVQVDNYNDLINETKEDKLPFVKAEMEKKINIWANRMNGMIKKYQNDKFIVIFEKKYLENLEQKRFTILDDLREIDEGNKIPITLSIGVGVDGISPSALEEDAFMALELALGRGGDQAVVRKNNSFEFYGGKTKAVEKRNRVKARIIAHGLRTLIDESSHVIIMGHKFPDMDSFGASIGAYRGVINKGKDAYIVLNDVGEPIKNVYSMFAGDEMYQFISSEKAIELMDENTLVVVVDTHRPSSTECPELLEMTDNIVLIDHHRQGTDAIKNTVLRYMETYASSASELVTEILQYLEDKPKIEKNEAEALLAGIAVDTKNFSFKTGVRTFDAAAYLRRLGADTTLVRQLFQDDLSTYTAIADIVRNAEKYNEHIAISVCEEVIENSGLVAAQGADSLLNIRGINTSFAIVHKDEDTISISARSLGKTNVQLILEKIGGGGHLEIAGAQFKDKSMREVKKLLIHAIEQYIGEMEGE